MSDIKDKHFRINKELTRKFEIHAKKLDVSEVVLITRYIEEGLKRDKNQTTLDEIEWWIEIKNIIKKKNRLEIKRKANSLNQISILNTYFLIQYYINVYYGKIFEIIWHDSICYGKTDHELMAQMMCYGKK